jgi:NAD(P)-dependent dehydrogenase (short-subunit alcohol dehydrogenase family)
MFLMSRAALSHIRAAGGGTIVNIASVQGLQSMPRVAAYAASKGGVLSLTRAMALDHAHEGIRVVAICPGTIDSAMVRAIARAEGGDEEANIRRYGAAHPLGRIGTPADIGAAAVFLASDAASFITGEHLNVDGGFMALGAWATSAGADR